MLDAVRQAEAAATEERCYVAEAAAHATREAELGRREVEAASRVVALDTRAQALTDREETAHREAAAAAAAKDRAAEVEREARNHASAVAQDAATKVKEARLLLKGEQQEAAHRVTVVKAVAFDAAMRAAAAEEKAAHLDAAEGIVQGFEDEARTQTLAVAIEMVNTLVPAAPGDPPAEDGADPEAQPEDTAEGAELANRAHLSFFFSFASVDIRRLRVRVMNSRGGSTLLL
jgi:hypothetical protein